MLGPGPVSTSLSFTVAIYAMQVDAALWRASRDLLMFYTRCTTR